MEMNETTKHPIRTLLVAAAVAVAFGLLVVPVQATYVNRVGSDFTEFRTASCGAPVASLAGADPGLDGGSQYPIGGETAEIACDAASGKRVIGALVVLLGASLGWAWDRGRRPADSEPQPDEVHA